MSQRRFSGVIPPTITALDADETLDRAGMARLVEHQIRGVSTGCSSSARTARGRPCATRSGARSVRWWSRRPTGGCPTLHGTKLLAAHLGLYRDHTTSPLPRMGPEEAERYLEACLAAGFPIHAPAGVP
jgi:hypothetical protein